MAAKRRYLTGSAWLGLFAAAAVAMAWFLATPGDTRADAIHEASTTVRFAGPLGLPSSAASIASQRTPGAPATFTGDVPAVETASAHLKPPFSASVSDDGMAVTFRARSYRSETAVRYVDEIARRFMARIPQRAVSSTGIDVATVGEADVVGASVWGGSVRAGFVFLGIGLAVAIAEWARSQRPWASSPAPVRVAPARAVRRTLPRILEILLP